MINATGIPSDVLIVMGYVFLIVIVVPLALMLLGLIFYGLHELGKLTWQCLKVIAAIFIELTL